MPLTSDRDRANEIQSGNEKTIPLPVAILIVFVCLAAICIAGYFILSLFF